MDLGKLGNGWMKKYNNPYLDEELEILNQSAKNPKIREEWAELATKHSMISTVGEYVPVEFVALLNYIDELEQELDYALSGKWNDKKETK